MCVYSVCCLELETIYISLSSVLLSCLGFYPIYFPPKKSGHIKLKGMKREFLNF